ncbi:unnamed protein product [Adineta steineri]|uniref:Uncharacterized protein n=1 Tax=Adineta steineri TaxID=433720 RepID=A0A818RMW3_9BILA|nr:unnamed protein product [Adineta steineri]CAF3659967.1 unnamed protein product [Adineta steineri]
MSTSSRKNQKLAATTDESDAYLYYPYHAQAAPSGGYEYVPEPPIQEAEEYEEEEEEPDEEEIIIERPVVRYAPKPRPQPPPQPVRARAPPQEPPVVYQNT